MTFISELVPLYWENFNLTDIITPVNVMALHGLLIESGYNIHKTKFLVNGFSEGFSLGYQGPKIVKRLSPNLKLRVGSDTILWNKLMKEVMTGRVAGPFEDIPFDNYIQSPIGPSAKGRWTGLQINFPSFLSKKWGICQFRYTQK